MKDSDILHAICADRDAHRAEIIDQKSIHIRLVLAFLTIAGVAAGLYWDEGIVSDPTARAWLLFAAAQIEFLLALLYLQGQTDMQFHACYIASLEIKINELVGERVSVWESIIQRKRFLNAHSAIFWAGVLILIVFSSIFLVLMLMALHRIRGLFPAVVLVTEIIATCLCTYYAAREARKSYQLSEWEIDYKNDASPISDIDGDME